MSALDIPPHSGSASRLALIALGLIAAFGLVSGYLRQVVAMTPEPMAAADGRSSELIAEATPAPEPMLQVTEPPPRRVATAEPPDLSEAIAPVAADAAPAADASAAAPDPTAPEPAAPAAPNDAPAL